ncbi:MAG: hypothetical protein HY329_15975 [Chloroflexi bacterium]|nr:hypothetical protein [Chloroflexota bacterium]
MTTKGNDQALIALLASGSTIKDAAAKAGMSESTAHRRLEDRAFQSAVAEARKAMLSRTVGLLADATTEAVSALRRNLACGAPSTEVRAAVAILEQSVKVAELVELEQRVTELEAKLATQGEKKR